MPHDEGVKVFQETIAVKTKGRALYDVTAAIAAAVARSGVRVGVAHVFLQHTSASLVVQENADPAVLRDLEKWLSELAPESRAWEHDAEGPDDMPAHARAAITRASEQLPIVAGALGLGTWQALYLWEHRRAPHERRLLVTAMGTT